MWLKTAKRCHPILEIYRSSILIDFHTLFQPDRQTLTKNTFYAKLLQYFGGKNFLICLLLNMNIHRSCNFGRE